jgi:hypothetical protein
MAVFYMYFSHECYILLLIYSENCFLEPSDVANLLFQFKFVKIDY